MRTGDISSLVQTTKPAVPQIYAYTTPEIARHNGWTKIGYTEQDVNERIKQQTHTADVIAQLEWHGNALFEDGSGSFRDQEFHTYLRKLDVNNTPDTEWFEIEPDPAHTRFFEFRENHGVLTDMPETIDYELRSEQIAAVEDTVDYLSLHEKGEFLWNAKPRFGKTLTSYELCKQLGAQKILIVTNRPAIANSWYDDYAKFLGMDSGYCFVSDVEALAGKKYCLSWDKWEEYSKSHSDAVAFIEFVSLQNLKGSRYFGGKYKKLKHIADTEWDVLIIDEAHEGVDTFKTDVAFDHIKRNYTLHLSGTPFKAIANNKFAEDAIYNWTYADEQEAKDSWDNPELPNPYADLPRLNMFTYKMSDIVEAEAAQGIDLDGETVDYAFDLNEFFSTKENGTFVHNKDIDSFLDALVEQKKFPFSTPELRDELKHTLWMLYRVDSAKKLAEKLRTHPVFKDYEIILAAGDGKLDDEDAKAQAFDRVREAIATHDKTITLSVRQLTTGVTIPEWTGVLMLSNMESPSLYMQAAFRAQNPCLFNNGDGTFARKENAYVFDFDPARTLDVYERFANDLYTGTAGGGGSEETRKKHIAKLLNYFPVYGEDNSGEMIELDAAKVMTIPRKIRSQEVVRHGFMSDFLFQNIGRLFNAPQAALDILNKFEPYKEPTATLGFQEGKGEELDIDKNGDVNIPEEQVIGTAADIFGAPVYEQIADNLNDQVAAAVNGNKTEDEEDRELAALAEKFSTAISKPLVETAQEKYGSDMSSSQQKKLERKIAADVTLEVERHFSDYKIQKDTAKEEFEAAMQVAQTDEDCAQAEQTFQQKLEEVKAALQENLATAQETLTQSAAFDIVNEVETAKKESEKKTLQEDIRDQLRGFSRTIPSFLMAYGNENTTLKTFDSIIPEQVFLDVTSITADEFRFLRDGGDYKDANGETQHFGGELFDETVFNDSVQEFIKKRTELANYFDLSIAEDIFDYVPPQKTNQIFTPKRVVKQMVDLFEEENPGCFDDPEHTFADLYMKSGLYITEIITRLYNSDGMKAAFPNEDARLRHILEEQVYGIAPTEIIYQIATHFILGYNNEVGFDYSHHFIKADSAELAKEGKLADFVAEKFGLE